MAELFIDDEGAEKWIQFDRDTEVLVKLQPRAALKSLARKAEKSARLTGENERDIFNLLLAKSAIKGWRKTDDHAHPGLTVNGQPLPFTLENVKMLMEKSTEFFRFIDNYAVNSREFLTEGDDSKNA